MTLNYLTAIQSPPDGLMLKGQAHDTFMTRLHSRYGIPNTRQLDPLQENKENGCY